MLLAYPVAHRSWDVDPVQQEAMAPLPKVLRIDVDPDGPLNRTYLGDDPDPVLAFIAPDGTGVAGLPPTYVVVCEYDDLRTTGELFVRQARAAGVPVELAMATGLVHGHLNRTPALPQVDATLRDMARVVVEATVHAG
jgi:acetyl esterase/lipase